MEKNNNTNPIFGLNVYIFFYYFIDLYYIIFYY